MRAHNYLSLILLLAATTCCCLAASSSSTSSKKSKESAAIASASTANKQHSDDVSSITQHQASAKAPTSSAAASPAQSSSASASSSVASPPTSASSSVSHKESKSAGSGREQSPAEISSAEADMIDSAIEAQQQEQHLQQQMREDQQQEAADKKQGEQQNAAVDDSMDSMAANEEYVQIKPEEIDMSSGKDLDSSVSLLQSASEQQPAAEHKSIDDELSAHLAQESVYHPAIVPLKPSGARPSGKSYHPFSPPLQAMHPMPPPPPRHNAYPPPPPPPQHAAAAPRPAQRPHHAGQKLPHHQTQPGYTALKGKLTGINSLISQYPHPAPGYPHQGPKHLPRGAAAGFASFRDFVRAHASKYKHAAAAAVAPEPAPGKDYSKELPQPAFVAPQAPPAAKAPGYGPAPSGLAPPAARPAGPQYGGANSGPKAQRLTVAQAYIPHLSPAPTATGGYGNPGAAPQQSSGGYGANPILAGLYGQHAPQGAGKPEYSQDYGMVIHYPQATVYTEPMSVDQLHKLTGAGITQVLSQLQHNLANGHRDESNTLRPNSAHHIGNGLHIHAKEFYAPSKSGHYVPTTAAIISGPGPAAKHQFAYDQPAASEQQQPQSGAAEGGYGSLSVGPNLGAGYERVKQAVAAGQDQRYNNRYPGQTAAAPAGPANNQQQYGKPAAAQAGYGPAPAAGSGSQYGAEPLSAVTNYLSSELEALHKANDVFTKQIGPEADAQLQAYSKSAQAKGPLRYENLENQQPPRSYGPQAGPYGPFSAPQQVHNQSPLRGPRPPVYGLPGAAMLRGPPNRYHAGPRGQRGPRRGPHGPRANRYSQTGANRAPHRPMPAPAGPYQQQPQFPPRGPRSHPSYRQPQPQQQQQQPPAGGYPKQGHQAGYRQQQQQQQQQQAQYSAIEQALNQQMNQLIQEFQAGDEQYNGKSQPAQPATQGYPHKVMQKYSSQYRQQQQQQSYGQQAQSAYAQAEGPEIQQGPHDQIGEIAELIEALKNTLESRKPDAPEGGQYGSAAPAPAGPAKQPATNLDDIRYLTTVLGQMPTYPIQVPVGPAPADSAQAAYEQAKKGPATDAYPQPQQTLPAPIPEQPNAYQQQTAQQAYDQQPAAGPQYQSAAKPVEQSYQAPITPASPSDSYGQQSSQGQADTYAAAMQQVRATLAQAQAQSPSYGQHVVAGTYPQATPAQAQAIEQQQPASAYSNSENAQVINHLVPSTQQQQSQGYAADQSASQQQQQPANQIAVSAPTEAQYQQAQSLSSFVDSLPTDYQELLRQPALLDGQSNAQQLAVLGQEGQYATQGNVTTSASSSLASGQPLASYGTTYQLTQTHTQVQHPSASISQQQQGYQQQQQSTASKSNSGSHEASGTAQQGQYAATVKK